jgi:hypothetical protein
MRNAGWQRQSNAPTVSSSGERWLRAALAGLQDPRGFHPGQGRLPRFDDRPGASCVVRKAQYGRRRRVGPTSELSLKLHGAQSYHAFPRILRSGGLIEALGPEMGGRKGALTKCIPEETAGEP